MLNLLRYALLLVAFASTGAVVASDIHRELDDIAKRLATKIEDSKRTKVAVADFTDLDGTLRQVGRFVSEELSTNLVLSARGFSVIDRNHLRTILREQKLSMSGLMDPENQKKLGKILGVDALVLGSINPFGESYRITFKVVATDTAEVIAADRGMVPKTPATDQLWDTIIREDLVTETTEPKPTSRPTTTTTSSAPAQALSPVRPRGIPEIVPQPKLGEYGSQFLTFVIESLGVNKEKGRAILVGRLTNVSRYDIYVAAYRHDDNNPGISLVDDSGNLWIRVSGVVGLPTYPYDDQKRTYHRETTERHNTHFDINTHLALMTPGQSQPINVAFKLADDEDEVGDPKIYSFSANLHVKVPETIGGVAEEEGKPAKRTQSSAESKPQWRYTSTSIGISGIKLQ